MPLTGEFACSSVVGSSQWFSMNRVLNASWPWTTCDDLCSPNPGRETVRRDRIDHDSN